VRFYGPIQSPCLYNTTTGLKLCFENYFVLSGGYVEVDCRPESLAVRDQFGINRAPMLTSDSHPTTFYLVPGANNIRITGSELDHDSAIEIRYAIKEKP
jgi:hypothetical protein